eukprot:CAMPEP_0180689622 /NCGR_PEP_ID=MMETSP1037_2-20121125/74598_1 /TAXON_ID=632150 /ORGANISM="Azadinium spinosum, Strain 3D9" /LENGTH=147 /DNA_ID=CAMNT_0022720513 /DNA_START=40 /DNA_END=483 /DNA_ORIENTATION=+
MVCLLLCHTGTAQALPHNSAIYCGAACVGVAQEIQELRAAGQSPSAGLCNATELCALKFQGQEWQVQAAKLAPKAYWVDVIQKELFGLGFSSPAAEGEPSENPIRVCLELLLGLTSPNPFAQEPQKLVLALTNLDTWLLNGNDAWND